MGLEASPNSWDIPNVGASYVFTETKSRDLINSVGSAQAVRKTS